MSESHTITIEALPESEQFLVVITTPENITSKHTVTMKEFYLNTLGLADCDREQVLRNAIEFLLEQEPAEEILPVFAVSDIARYFPEFSTDIRKRMAVRTE